jgi:hypothetical protein
VRRTPGAALKPAAPKTVKLTISATTEDAWVRIVAGAGGKQVAGTIIPAGQSIGPTTNTHGFTIVQAPRYQAVQLTVNGKTYSLTPPGPWRVTATGVTSATAAH